MILCSFFLITLSITRICYILYLCVNNSSFSDRATINLNSKLGDQELILMMSTLLHDSDFYRWTVEQVERLRLGKWDGLDIENLAEEIESLGSQKRSELENRLAILLAHLIKWDLQPRLRGKS